MRRAWSKYPQCQANLDRKSPAQSSLAQVKRSRDTADPRSAVSAPQNDLSPRASDFLMRSDCMRTLSTLLPVPLRGARSSRSFALRAAR